MYNESACLPARAALLFSLAILAVSCATAPSRPLPPPGGAAVLSLASRTDYGGVPMLRLRGTPAEVGYQYGSLLAPELGSVTSEFSSLLDAVVGTGAGRWAADRYLLGLARKALAALPPDYADELRGISAGSGLPYDGLLVLAMTPELLFDINCSSFVTREGGRLIHARNFDFYFPGNAAARHPLVVRYEIEGKTPFVSAGFVGLFGTYTGSNDAGVSATEDTAIFTRKPSGIRAPVGYALRMVLEGSRGMADARAILESASTRGYLVTVSSLAEGEASVFELVGDGCLEDRMAGDGIRVANRCLSEVNRRENALILADFDVNTARESALDRALARTAGGEPLSRARAVLADRSFAGLAALPPLQSLLQDGVRTINNYTTIQSCVIDPAARELHVSWREGYAASGAFIRVGLDDLSSSASFPPDGLLESADYARTRDFISAMHGELMAKGFSFSRADYARLYPRVLEADLPELVKADWVLSFALRLGDWPRAREAAASLRILMPGSYYGPFWEGYSLLKLGRAAEARDALEAAAAAEGLSPFADLVASVFRAEAAGALGDSAGRSALQARASALLGGYRYSEGLERRVAAYFPDPLLGRALRELAPRR